jgi:Chaperone of endosialidase
MKTKDMTTLHLRKSSGPATAGRAFLLIPLALALAWLALSPTAQAQLPSPAPDGGYPNGNTAEGDFALFLTTGGANTAIGSNALVNNTTGSSNTATGLQALLSNTTGNDNTANGRDALLHNTGSFNTASGATALYRNTTADSNTATGFQALYNNTGDSNTANGVNALVFNTTGNSNTATGLQALYYNTTGGFNTANGRDALLHNTGSFNIALGFQAGLNLTTGSNNIDIGNAGVAGDSGKIRIGKSASATYISGIYGKTVASGVAVRIDSSGHLGTLTSSARFKEAIKPMDKASEAILALQPVTFRYKHELDPEGIPQFGLVAEEVEKVNPALVARDAEGKVFTVRYEVVNAMLLNEFLKEHRKVEGLQASFTQQQKDFQATAAQQQKEIKALTASLKEQASQIQKVSAQVELSKPAPQMAVNNQ